MGKLKRSISISVIVFIFLFSIIIFTSCSGNTNSTGGNNTNTGENNANTTEEEIPLKFQKGETISYKLNAIIGHVGNQLIEILDVVDLDGVKCYYVKSTTTLIPEIEEQFSYDYEDIIYSYIDISTMLPKKVIKDVKQGNYEDNVEITFDQENKTGLYISKRNHPEGKEFKWEVDGLLYLLSAIYYVRAKEINIGDEFSINILDEKTFKPIEGKVKAVEGEQYKQISTIQLTQLDENEAVSLMTMRLIDNNGKNWIPVNITIGIMKVGNLTLSITGEISSYKESE